MKIDLVYLWVDGADIEWQRRRHAYLHGVDQSDNETFCAGRTANSNELLYSLRSVEMYAPWINHIFIITDNQCPEWLDTSNPKVSIVDHSEIFPSEVLPLYSSRAIEFGIHRIKNLSEHYLYANDDMMLGRAISPEQFFTTNGVVKCYFKRSKTLSKPKALKSTYNNTIKNVNNTISKDLTLRCENWTPHHQIDAYIKSSVRKCVERYNILINNTINSRFRSRNDINRHILSLYTVAMGDGVAIVKQMRFINKVISRLAISLGLSKGVSALLLAIHKKKLKKRIEIFNPALICFNDTPDATDDDRERLKLLLEKLYPQKSQFEK